ncbi:MAG: phosphatidylserine decarboxylase [[Clostridium] symbiosum]|uniref:phosphatidylserine decarboxylase n=1 Tax=Lachnospiraceae TaxID=186803 RepID=UPI0011DD6DDC|nr:MULTISPECIES: phosphatidylserine decarboxylase [Clostridia]
MANESKLICFLYNNIAGRCCLKILTMPWISRQAGRVLDSRLSRPYIPFFIKKHKVDLNEFEHKEYRSFNDFFKRSLLTESRKIDSVAESLISPCDGLLSVYKIDERSLIPAKHSIYRMEDLLENKELADSYNDGWCFVFRLRPSDYHHYCYIDHGNVRSRKRIPGILHCVRPIAMEKYPVYVQNTREYTLIDTENFGQVVQMEIGALLVGKIQNSRHQGYVRRGTEKGYFEFGGSTVIILIQKEQATPELAVWMLSKLGQEVEVKMGQKIGCKGN